MSQCLHLIAAEYKRCHCFWAHSMDRARKYTGTHTCVYMYVHLCLFIFCRNHEFTLTSVTIQCQMVDSSLPPFHICSFLLFSDSGKSDSFILKIFTYLINLLGITSLSTMPLIFLASAADSDLHALAKFLSRCWWVTACGPSLPNLFCYKCDFKRIFFFLVGLENSQAVCVLAGSDHSASLTGRSRAIQNSGCFCLECCCWDTDGRA